MIYNIAYNWFLLFYFAAGLIFLIQGLVWYRRPESLLGILQNAAEHDKKPTILLKSLRYFLLFTLISIFFSFFPFSPFEFGFAFVCLILMYFAGSMLLKWDEYKEIVQNEPALVTKATKKAGLNLLVLSITCFALCYRFLITNIPA